MDKFVDEIIRIYIVQLRKHYKSIVEAGRMIVQHESENVFSFNDYLLICRIIIRTAALRICMEFSVDYATAAELLIFAVDFAEYSAKHMSDDPGDVFAQPFEPIYKNSSTTAFNYVLMYALQKYKIWIKNKLKKDAVNFTDKEMFVDSYNQAVEQTSAKIASIATLIINFCLGNTYGEIVIALRLCKDLKLKKAYNYFLANSYAVEQHELVLKSALKTMKELLRDNPLHSPAYILEKSRSASATVNIAKQIIYELYERQQGYFARMITFSYERIVDYYKELEKIIYAVGRQILEGYRTELSHADLYDEVARAEIINRVANELHYDDMVYDIIYKRSQKDALFMLCDRLLYEARAKTNC